MDRLDRKIKKALSKKLEISTDYRESMEAFIERLPHHYPPRREKHKLIKHVPKFVTISAIAASAVSVCAYTGGVIYSKVKEIQIDAVTSVVNTEYDDIKEIMNSKDNWYYKFFTNYNEYLEFKNCNYGQILEMQEYDFEEECILLLFNSSDGYDSMYISDIKNTNNELEIIIRKDNSSKEVESERLISLKLDKDMYNENINFILETERNMFISATNLPIDYTKEQAIKDNCIVIYNEKIISDNINAIDEFISNARNGKEEQIRIIVFNDVYPNEKYFYEVVDVGYINGVYELSKTQIGNIKNTDLYSFENIIKFEDEEYICYGDDYDKYIIIKK